MERLVLEKRCFIIHAPQFLRGVEAGIACDNRPELLLKMSVVHVDTISTLEHSSKEVLLIIPILPCL